MPTLQTKRRKTRNHRKPGAIGNFVRSMFGAAAALVIVPVASLLKLLPNGEWFSQKALDAWQSRTTRRIAGLAGGVLLVIGLCIVAKRNLEGAEMYAIDPGRIELTVNPAWAKPELAQRLRTEIETDLRDTLAKQTPTNAFDERIGANLTAALEHCPWVAKVVRIERRFPREAHGHAEFHPVIDLRKPALCIETSEGGVLLDGDGVRLPLTLKTSAERDAFTDGMNQPLRLVRGVTSEPPQAGKLWDSQEITCALSMERVLRESAMDSVLPIEAMELVGVPSTGDGHGHVRYKPGGGVVLLPDQRLLPGTSLLWGRPPVHASTLEPTLDEKLSVMRRELADPESLKGRALDLSVHKG